MVIIVGGAVRVRRLVALMSVGRSIVRSVAVVLLGIRTKNRAESLVLSQGEVSLDGSATWMVMDLLTGSIGMLVVVALILRRQGEAT